VTGCENVPVSEELKRKQALRFAVSDGSTRGGIQMEEIGQELPLLEVSREARRFRAVERR
jgi:hypothetical protein